MWWCDVWLCSSVSQSEEKKLSLNVFENIFRARKVEFHRLEKNYVTLSFIVLFFSKYF